MYKVQLVLPSFSGVLVWGFLVFKPGCGQNHMNSEHEHLGQITYLALLEARLMFHYT